ncbi:SMP-30/gluconolactonase/LRE family protein [Roseiconus nitratireducens]|uniref:SMP-30/gluconolactonase/LRE family protein n=1 Tax=Roseiconus nitratireducens TaxID=2605748 RepID=A0A5M6DAU7_9BACT|nr:SMP-30/gluconolactonase/LRE family protein [Roseiconus nitratireducens]KAA5543646.1 SMP-30/gluconolactonase/LRE family protein [Roseiconus nitratireducens]
MRNLCFLLAAFAACVCTVPCDAQTPATLGHIEVLSPKLEKFVDAETKIEVLAGGFTWTEGPVWFGGDGGGYLLFSDIPRNSIFRWSAARGVELFMRPSGYTGVSYYGLEPGSNGLTRDPQGRLTMCEHGDRRVSVLTRGGGKRTLVDMFEGKRLNSPNDLTFDKAGNLYFTDPPYGLPERAEDPRRELDFCGVYRLGSDGKLSLLTKQMTRPNGIGLSPDEKTLYVAQSDPENPIWMAFPIQDDGTLGEGKQLQNASAAMKEYPGLPDGLTVANDGTLFGSGPGGVYVISPEGELLGRIITGGRCSNCTFDTEQKTLYITADDYLCRVKLK